MDDPRKSTDSSNWAQKTNESEETDWNYCCLCQQVKDEQLRHPYKKEQYHKDYSTLETNLLLFRELEEIPFGINLRRLGIDGSGIAKTLLEKEAKYHHSCGVECSESRYKRKIAQKINSEEKNSDSVISPKKTRSSFSSSVSRRTGCSRTTPECLLCGQKESDSSDREQLHKASSHQIDENVKVILSSVY